MFRFLSALADRLAGKPAAPRSPHWPAVRAYHLRREPCCMGCGAAGGLQVHHVLPFHLYPGRELDDANLITLCEGGARNCHYAFGHAYNWRGWVPSVRADAAEFRGRVAQSNANALRKTA